MNALCEGEGELVIWIECGGGKVNYVVVGISRRRAIWKNKLEVFISTILAAGGSNRWSWPG
jgi:hypothetical protein